MLQIVTFLALRQFHILFLYQFIKHSNSVDNIINNNQIKKSS